MTQLNSVNAYAFRISGLLIYLFFSLPSGVFAAKIPCIRAVLPVAHFGANILINIAFVATFSSPVLAISTIEVKNLAVVNRVQNLLDETLRTIDEKREMNSVFGEVDLIVNNFNLKNVLNRLAVLSSVENKTCVTINGDKAIDHLNTMIEYFSVSNDFARSRMMISESYRGQKMMFVKQGLIAAQKDFKSFFRCYPYEVRQYLIDFEK